MSYSRPKSSGFTLLELVLVMALLALIMAAVAPSFSGFLRGRENIYAATRFATLARYARTQAVAEARTYRINYDAAKPTFFLTADNGAGTFEALTGEAGLPMEIAPGVKVQADFPLQQDGTYVLVRPSGLTDQASAQFVSTSGSIAKVVCESATDIFRVVRDGGTR